MLLPRQSIAPPPLVLTLLPGENAFPVTSINYTVDKTTSAGTMTMTAPTATSTAVTTPTPYPANIASGCIDFYLVQEGDCCWSITTVYDLDPSKFETWNPDVGTDCSNGVWLGYYYCVAHASKDDKNAIKSTTTSSGALVSFGSTSHVITIQPQATHTEINPPSPISPIAVETGKPDHTQSGGCSSNSTSSECGHLNCGLWGCDGGCGLGWCGGRCGLLYCGPGCGNGKVFLHFPIHVKLTRANLFLGDCIIDGGGWNRHK